MSDTVRAKFIVTKKSRTHVGRADGKPMLQETIEAQPVYGDSDENKLFWEYTPSGSLTMTCTREGVLAALEPGTEFYLDFTPVG